MKGKSTIAKLTSLALLVATLTIYTSSHMGAAVNAAPATAPQAQTTPPSTDIEFGAIKLGRSQNALIIVVCAADQNARDQRPVDVEFMFYDWDGNLLASETKTVMPGHASSFDLQGTGVPHRSSEIQPCIKVLVDPSDPIADRIIATLQVSDESGRAQFALNAAVKNTHSYFASSSDGVFRFNQGE